MKFKVSSLKLQASAFFITLLIAATASASSGPFSEIYQFNGPDGSFPNRVVADSSGNLYGTTLRGGAYDSGAIYQLIPPAQSGGAWTVTVLYSFTGGADGWGPGDVTIDQQGNLYGLTYESGNGQGYGVVYKFAHNPDGSWTESTLHTFTGGADGGIGAGAPVLDTAGNLYGITSGGGNSSCVLGCGVVFRLTPSSSGWTEKVLYSFTSSGSHSPSNGLLLRGGKLYGTTSFSPTFGPAVFQLSLNGQINWIYDFQNAGDGSLIPTVLSADPSGNLYGVSQDGGDFSKGSVFELSPPSIGSDSWTRTILYSFQGSTDGLSPISLIRSGNGTLYGTTMHGGAGCLTSSGCGTIFSLVNSGGNWTKQAYLIRGTVDSPASINLISGQGFLGTVHTRSGFEFGGIFKFSY